MGVLPIGMELGQSCGGAGMPWPPNHFLGAVRLLAGEEGERHGRRLLLAQREMETKSVAGRCDDQLDSAGFPDLMAIATMDAIWGYCGGWIVVRSNEGGGERLLLELEGACRCLDLAVINARRLDDESRRLPALRSRCLVAPLSCFNLLQQMGH
ncbi:hypothetical protein ACLOJK_037567 [Asimina triloba]